MGLATRVFIVFYLVGSVVSFVPQKRQSECASIKNKTTSTVSLVCRSLRYLDGTMRRCPADSACNPDAIMTMMTGIQGELCEWVGLAELHVNVTFLCTYMNYEFGCLYARPPDYYSDNQLLSLLREPQQFHHSGILQYLFAQCFMQLRASRTVLNTHAGQVQKLWTSVHNSV